MLVHKNGKIASRSLFQQIRIKPLQILASGLLIISPFLAWIVGLFFVMVEIKTVKLLLDESEIAPNLWAISNNQAGLAVSQTIEIASFYSALLLILGGIVLFRYPRIGLLTSTLGVVSFSVFSYGTFGETHSASTTALIVPGIGLFVASFGIVLGSVALREKERTLSVWISTLKTREGMTKTGTVIAAITLALDGINHTTLGQIQDFIGVTPLEMLIHLGFVCGVILLLGLEVLHVDLTRPTLVTGISILSFAFMISDGAYHYASGDIYEFIGHGSVEIVLHTLTYYGLALAALGRIFRR
jgi:hypothetical protein